MKKILFILTVSLLLTSCEDCIIREVEGGGGEPVETCPPYYALFLNGEPNVLPDYRSLINPINKPNEFVQIANAISAFQFGSNFRPDFSAFNKNENVYAYSFYNEDGLNEGSIYISDLNSQLQKTVSLKKDAAAPVFANNELWAIDVTPRTASRGNIEIFKIDINNGAINVVFRNQYNVDGQLNDIFMSSATDNKGNIYFVSDNQLISFNTLNNNFQIRNLDENNDPDNRRSFYGLEYDVQNDRLLAIGAKTGSSDQNEELTAIPLNNFTPQPIITLINLYRSKLSLLDGLLYRSVDYDNCTHSYVISEPKSLEENQGNLFVKIDLSDLRTVTSSSEGYYFGLENGK
jgi:hypothetical protein